MEKMYLSVSFVFERSLYGSEREIIKFQIEKCIVVHSIIFKHPSIYFTYSNQDTRDLMC